MAFEEFEKDENGEFVARPVTGYSTATIAGMAILLLIRYRELQQETEIVDKSIQFALTPEQCLLLAEALRKGAKAILDQPHSDQPRN